MTNVSLDNTNRVITIHRSNTQGMKPDALSPSYNDARMHGRTGREKFVALLRSAGLASHQEENRATVRGEEEGPEGEEEVESRGSSDRIKES
jgi:hypothetical protein